MGLKDAKEGKLLYHLTELKNLESIIDFGLVPRKILREYGNIWRCSRSRNYTQEGKSGIGRIHSISFSSIFSF